MSFKPGNQLWKARTKHGRDKLFASAETLWKACCEYFQWVEDNPLYEAKLITHMGKGTIKEVPKMRAMTLDGLCIFLNIVDETWRAWRKDDDFSGVVAQVDKIIRDQKFSGAAADLLNSNIIARDLGLADKQVVKKTVAQISREMSPDEAAKAYQDLMDD